MDICLYLESQHCPNTGVFVGVTHAYGFDKVEKRKTINANHLTTSNGYYSKTSLKKAFALLELVKTLTPEEARAQLENDDEPDLIIDPPPADLMPVEPLWFQDVFIISRETRSIIEALARALSTTLLSLAEDNVSSITLFTTQKTFNKHLNNLFIWEKNNWRTPNNGAIPYVEVWKMIANGLRDIPLSINLVSLPPKLIELDSEEEDTVIKETEEEEKPEPVSSFLGEEHTIGLARLALNVLVADRDDEKPNSVNRFNQDYWVNVYSKPQAFTGKFIHLPRLPNDNRLLMVSPGKNVAFIGRRITNAAYTVIYKDEPEAETSYNIVNAFHYRSHTTDDREARVFCLSLEALYKFSNAIYIKHYGDLAVLNNGKYDHSLYTPLGIPVVQVIDPPALAYRAIEIFDTLMGMAYSADHLDEDNANYRIIDIKDELFETVYNKKGTPSQQLKKAFEPATKYLKITTRVIPGYEDQDVAIPLGFGTDLLPRNSLKRIEKTLVEIKVFIRMISPSCFMVATLVKDAGYSLIQCNYYCSVIYLPGKEE